MKKYFVFSDVHGFYDEFIRDLLAAGFDMKNNNHILISCGDNFDRGFKSVEMFTFLNNFPAHRKFLIKGNHEYLLEDLAKRKVITSADVHNGTADTYTQFQAALKDENITEVVKFMKNMYDFVDIKGHIFTHGFLPAGDYKNATREEWEMASWIDSSQLLDNLPKIDRMIVVGHKATTLFHDYPDMFIKQKTPEHCGLIALDGTTISTRKINIFVLNEDGTYDNDVYMHILNKIILY